MICQNETTGSHEQSEPLFKVRSLTRVVAPLWLLSFIIDQHATDEKYRFELLQRTTTLNSQPLLNPLPLDCTPSMEIVIKEHLHIFRQNGFQIELESEEATAAATASASDDSFHDDSQASPMDAAVSRRCIRVKTLPFTKNITFGAADIYELCALLNENPGVMVRLPKVSHAHHTERFVAQRPNALTCKPCLTAFLFSCLCLLCR